MSTKNGFWWGTGRRKTAIARVRIREGSGKMIINGRPLNEFFALSKDQILVQEPLRVTKLQRNYDVFASITGGGFSGQAGALAMGLGRALCAANGALGPVMRENGFLTRDSRMVERKKYGKRKARRSFQFSKR
ncbi:MAG: 30S ribosomal protein S9 [Planctomycetota bacterium]